MILQCFQTDSFEEDFARSFEYIDIRRHQDANVHAKSQQRDLPQIFNWRLFLYAQTSFRIIIITIIIISAQLKSKIVSRLLFSYRYKLPKRSSNV